MREDRVECYGRTYTRLMTEVWWQRYTRNPFVHQFVETLSVRVLISLSSVVTVVVTSRTLGPDGRGEVATALAAIGLCSLFGHFGFVSANSYYVARNREYLPMVVGNLLVISFAWGPVLSVSVWGMATLLPNIIPVHGTLLVLMSLTIPFNLGYMLAQGGLLGLQRFRAINVIELLGRALVIVAIIALYLLYFVTPNLVLTCTLTVSIFSLMASLKTVMGLLEEAARFSTSFLRESFRYSFKQYVASIFGYLVISIDLLMVSSMLGDKMAGLYSAVGAIGNMILMVSAVCHSLLFPRLAAIPTFEARWRICLRVMCIAGTITFVLCIFTGLLSRQIITVLFGSAFLPSHEALLWLLPGLVCQAVVNVAATMGVAINAPVMILVPGVLLAVLNVGLNLYMIPHYGINGASMCSTITYAVNLPLALCFIWWYCRDPS